MGVVLAQQRHRHHDVIDVVEDESAAVAVLRLGGDECEGVVAPVAAGVEVVRGVVAVIETVTV